MKQNKINKIGAIGKYVLLVLTVIILASELPNLYDISFKKWRESFSVYYSSVLKDFCFIRSENRKLIRYDSEGKTYTDREFDQILPLLNLRQLYKDNCLPDSINNEPVDLVELLKHQLFYRYEPSKKLHESLNLWPLFEAAPERLGLKMPDDRFRVKKSIQFIDLNSNTIDEKKSKVYNDSLTALGFHFPATGIYGVPTTHKCCDQGYFITDSKSQMFHTMMIKGKAMVKKTPIGNTCHPVHMDCFCMETHDTYGIVYGEEGGVYQVMTDDYKLKKLDLDKFDYDTQELLINGNKYYWTVAATTPEKREYYALEKESFKCIKRFEKVEKVSNSDKVAKYIFPFIIRFNAKYSDKIYPRIKKISAKALLFNAVLLFVFLIVFRKQRKGNALFIIAPLILLLGVYFFIPLAYYCKLVK